MVKQADFMQLDAMGKSLKIAKVDLTERWLKSLWPTDFGKKELKDTLSAIKSYKVAKRGTDSDALKTELQNIDSQADKLIAAMKKGNAKSYFPKTAKEIIGAVTEFKGIIAREIREVDRLNKPGTATQVVYQRPFSQPLLAEVQTKTGIKAGKLLTVPYVIEVELLTTFVNELKSVKADAQLNSQLNSLVNYEYKRALRSVLEAYEKYRSNSRITFDSFCMTAMKEIKDSQERINDQTTKICTSVLRNVKVGAEMEKAFKKSIRNKRIKLGVNTAFAAGSVAGLFFPGTAGFAAYGLARTTAALAQETASLFSTVNDKASVLNYHLSAIEKKAKDSAAKAKHAGKSTKKAVRETMGTILNTGLGVDIVPTIATVKSLHKDLNKQVAHIRFKHQKVVSEALDLVDEYDKIKKEVAANHKKMNKKGKTINIEDEVFYKTQITLEKVQSFVDQTEKILRPLATCETMLMSIERRVREMTKLSKLQKGVNITSEVLATLGGLAAGGVADAATFQNASGQAITHAERAQGVANSLVALGKELYERGKQTGEALEG
ncbi:hypothetical protein [Parasedimentitalea maritima]|uniref:hypothetical protein n=1 Tax=Parasedimentitalea maritima TaxID=2578117 RepID=UPI0010FE8DC4|nr:hypothetical protein [Zongyanglinia marina]